MAKNEKTSKKIGSLAAKVLADEKSTKISKQLAGSVLTQVADKKKATKKK